MSKHTLCRIVMKGLDEGDEFRFTRGGTADSKSAAAGDWALACCLFIVYVCCYVFYIDAGKGKHNGD